MGIWERPPAAFLDAFAAEFGFEPPREHGLDTVDAIRAMARGEVDVFIGMGGNFVSAAPDTERTAAGLASCGLTVQVSTKLNKSHAVCGEEALILPCLGRTERSEEHTSELQSLMRISYAVFCLKKKKITTHSFTSISTDKF